MAAASISLFVVIAAIVIIGTIVITIIVNAKKKKLENPPLLTDKATVASKRYDYKGGNVVYCVSFNIIGKSTLELPVPADQFENLKEGDFGTLAYQGRKFYGFTK